MIGFISHNCDRIHEELPVGVARRQVKRKKIITRLVIYGDITSLAFKITEI